MIKGSAEDMNRAIERYENHFNEKAPPMQALMSMPGVFLVYINKLDTAVDSNTPIEWNKDIDYDSDNIVY